MAKILLVNPPDGKMIQGAVPRELGRSRMGKYPPLGLLYIARSALAAHPELDIRILDAITDDLNHEDIAEQIENFQPDIVGISAYTFTLIDSLLVAKNAKKLIPTVKVVLGGFHPSIYPEETLRCTPFVDVAVAGEAEESFPLLVDRLLNHLPAHGIPGVSEKLPDGGLLLDHQVPFVADLNTLPVPDRRMVSYRKHSCILDSKGLTTNILFTRGCPYLCSYCYVNVKKYRVRSLDHLFLEIEECIALGINEFFFVDDLFNASRRHVIEFSERVIQQGLKINWNFRGRVNRIDEEVLEKASQAGCTRIHYGVETGNPEILQRIHKGTDLEMIRRAISLTRRYGIEVSANFMIGLPGESPRETARTIQFALELESNYLQAAVFTPYPRTPLYMEGLETGILPGDYWREFALQPREDFKPLIWGEYYTQEALFDQLRSFYRQFYLRPRFILGYVKKLKDMASLLQAVRNFFTFLFLITGKIWGGSSHD